MSSPERLALHPYQQIGAEFLATRRRAYLADAMGLGKSCQAIAACLYLAARRTLIVCPSVARLVWQDELELWAPDSMALVAKSLERFSERLPAGDEPLVAIVSYDYVRANAAALARGPAWDVLILDEAHMVSRLTAQRTQAVFGQQGIARHARRVWWLSGTPVENNPSELWLPLFFSGITKLTYAQWVANYCVGYERLGHFHITGARPGARLPNLDDFMLRRTRRQVFPELPPRPVYRVPVQAKIPPTYDLLLDPELEALARDMPALKRKLRLEEQLIARAFGSFSLFDVRQLEELRGLAQSVSTLLRYNGLATVGPAAGMIRNDIESGACAKIAVFFVHTSVGRALYHHLQALSPVLLTGETPPSKRTEAIHKFNNDPKTRVFLGQLRACGSAITLAGTDALVVEHGWDPASLAQALHRVRPAPGVPTVVTSRVLVLDDPMSRSVAALVERKAREIEELLP